MKLNWNDPAIIAAIITLIGTFFVSILLGWLEGRLSFTTVVAIFAFFFLIALIYFLYTHTARTVTAGAVVAMLVFGFLVFLFTRGNQGDSGTTPSVAGAPTSVDTALALSSVKSPRPIAPTSAPASTEQIMPTETAAPKTSAINSSSEETPSPNSQASTSAPTEAAENSPTSTASAIMKSTSIASSTRLGVLTVKALNECRSADYDIKVGDQTIGSGRTSEKKQVAEGTYDITFSGDIGTKVVRRQVRIQKGQEPVVDFSAELGALRLNSYPALKQRLYYAIYQGSPNTLSFSSDAFYCGSPGTYTVSFTSAVCGAFTYSPCFPVVAFFCGDDLARDVEVKAGKLTVVEPGAWPYKLGLISFKSPNLTDIKFKLQSQAYDCGAYDYVGNTNVRYWMLPGTYNIVFSDPFVGLTFNNVEIKPLQETVLELPSAP